jgi:hypothetical protein
LGPAGAPARPGGARAEARREGGKDNKGSEGAQSTEGRFVTITYRPVTFNYWSVPRY